MSDNTDEPAAVVTDTAEEANYYHGIAHLAGVKNVDYVKRVLLAAGYSHEPRHRSPGRLSQEDCLYLSGIMKERPEARKQAPSEKFSALLTKLVRGHGTSLVPDFFEMVERFNREVIGLTVPSAPTALSPGRAAHATTHLQEELDEFREAVVSGDLDKMADAIVDLVYVALGRLVEMGIAPRPVFEEVHAANMRKRRSTVSKRPHSAGHDAVKPEGWTPPNLIPYLTVTQEQLFRSTVWKAVRRTRTIEEANYEGRVKFKVDLAEVFPWFEHLSDVHRELAELRMKKGEDYNVGGPTIADYFPFGHRSYAQMVHVKGLRIQSLLAVLDAGREPNFEGLRDTLLDLLNYATFYVEAIDRGDLAGRLQGEITDVRVDGEPLPTEEAG